MSLPLGVLLGVPLAMPTASHAGVIFADSFQAGASALWQNEVGQWHASGGVYQAAAPSTIPNARSMLPFDLKDFQVEFDVNHIQDGGIWLRASPSGSGIGENGVLLVIGGQGGDGTGFYWHVVTHGSYGPMLASHSGLFTPGVSSGHVRVTVQGDTYSVYLNESAAPASVLNTAAFAHGNAGLYLFSPKRGLPVPSFDNVTISTSVPEPQSWAMLGCGVGLLLWRGWRRGR